MALGFALGIVVESPQERGLAADSPTLVVTPKNIKL